MGLGTVVMIVIMLAIVAFVLYMIYQKGGDWREGQKCTEQGGACKTSCGDNERFAPEGGFCETGRCCKPMDESGGSGGAGGAGGSNATTQRPISAPIIEVRQATTKGSLSSVKIFPGQNTPIQITFTTEAHTPTAMGCPKMVNSSGYIIRSDEVCAGQWHKRIQLQDSRGVVLYDWVTRQGNDSTPPAQSVKPELISVKLVPGSFKKTVEDNLYVTRSTYEVTPNFGFAQNKREYRLVITAYPHETPGESPSLETERNIPIAVTNGITVSGLHTQWTRSKTVTVSCDEQLLTCNRIFYYVTTPGIACDESVSGVNADLPVISQTATEHCISGSNECYLQLGECQRALSTRDQTSEYGSIISQVLDVISGSNQAQLNDPRLQAFSALQSNSTAVQCEERPYVRNNDLVVQTTAGAAPTFYSANLYDRETQRATIYLQHKNLENTSVCIYAEDANRRDDGGNPLIHLATEAQQTFIDLTPPAVELKYQPWKQKIHYICTDALSGCNDNVGVAYISDVNSFLRALFRGPQSAQAWCPRTGYKLQRQGETVYTEPEIRVMCMRGTDKAGNNATTMVTVYNTYGLLATAVTEAMKEAEN